MLVGGTDADRYAALYDLITAITAVHTPEQVQFYCLDFGRRLTDIAALPHVGSIAHGRDDERLRRIVFELMALLRSRRESFARLGIRDIAEFRDWQHSARQAGSIGDPVLGDGFGDVFLVVDHWLVLTEDHYGMEYSVNELCREGLSYGIHLILTASTWSQIRPSVRNAILTRIDLSPENPAERGGRRPVIVEPLFEAAATRSRGDYRAPEIPLLPTDLTRAELQSLADDAGVEQGPTRIVLGLTEAELLPWAMDFDIEPHLMVFGERECGKTTLLRNLIRGITENSTPEQARILAIDPCRTLSDAIPDEYLAGYASAHESGLILTRDLAEYLDRRFPGPDLTPRNIRERDWWTGPEIYLLVDDYERVVRAGSPNPLDALAESLSQAEHLGFHLILTRPVSGAYRAFDADPVLADLRADGRAALIMSGARDEGGFIAGVLPRFLPPGRGNLSTRAGGPDLIQLAR